MIDVEADARLGRRARRERTRRRRIRLLITLAAAAALALVAFSVLRYLDTRRDGAEVRAAVPVTRSTVPATLPQETLLFVRYDDTTRRAQTITLLAKGVTRQQNLIVFLPVGTFTEIPGHGLERLSHAHQFGGAALVEASVENLLGVDIDSTAALSEQSLVAFLDRTGGLEMQLEERLLRRNDAGAGEVRFQPGLQYLDGARLAELWSFRESDETEVATFARQQQVWEALLTATADERVAEALVGEGAPQLATDAEPADVRALMTGLAAAHERDELTFTVLPIEPFGGGEGGGTYQAKDSGVAELVAGPLAGSVPEGGGGAAIEIQILNGVGTPGIGTEVDRALEGGGFRTVLTDNARSFDYDETLILIYDDSDEAMEAARRVQQRLGVGTIRVSRQPQSLVDLTIVVGADFESTPSDPDAGESGTEPPEEQPT